MVRYTSRGKPRYLLRRRRTYGRRKAKNSFASRVKRILNRNLEWKYVDVYQQYTQIDRIDPGVAQLTYNGVAGTSITQGTSVNQRVGDRIGNMRLKLRLNAYYSPSATNPTHAFRVIVFQWHESTLLGVPTLGSILEYPSGSAGDYRVIDSPIAFVGQQQNDFTILYDRSFTLSAGSRGTYINRTFRPKHKLQFDPAAATGTGHVFIAIFGDDATGAHVPDLNVQWVSRIMYKDA